MVSFSCRFYISEIKDLQGYKFSIRPECQAASNCILRVMLFVATVHSSLGRLTQVACSCQWKIKGKITLVTTLFVIYLLVANVWTQVLKNWSMSLGCIAVKFYGLLTEINVNFPSTKVAEANKTSLTFWMKSARLTAFQGEDSKKP